MIVLLEEMEMLLVQHGTVMEGQIIEYGQQVDQMDGHLVWITVVLYGLVMADWEEELHGKLKEENG
jgi:hypothetical protein